MVVYTWDQTRKLSANNVKPVNEPGEVQHLMVEMSDGVRLSTYVYFPAGEGPWPVLLTRNPYPSPRESLGEIARVFNRYGYAVVVQEVRGTGHSEGEWDPFANDRKDGLDTLEWLTQQVWMDGNIGMYGHSYLAFTQWIVADQLPQPLAPSQIKAQLEWFDHHLKGKPYPHQKGVIYS